MANIRTALGAVRGLAGRFANIIDRRGRRNPGAARARELAAANRRKATSSY